VVTAGVSFSFQQYADFTDCADATLSRWRRLVARTNISQMPHINNVPPVLMGKLPLEHNFS
jgi:hypothetical protein